jgi:hypothetical protein
MDQIIDRLKILLVFPQQRRVLLPDSMAKKMGKSLLSGDVILFW